MFKDRRLTKMQLSVKFTHKREKRKAQIDRTYKPIPLTYIIKIINKNINV